MLLLQTTPCPGRQEANGNMSGGWSEGGEGGGERGVGGAGWLEYAYASGGGAWETR